MASTKLILYRDEARTVQNFFPYWYQLCNSKIDHPDNVENDKMMYRLLISVLNQVKKKFDKRLNGFAKKFMFTFTTAESITLVEFLKKQPIQVNEFWLHNLRQHIINVLHKQINGTIIR